VHACAYAYAYAYAYACACAYAYAYAYAYACSGSSLERACDVASVEDGHVSVKPGGGGQPLANAAADATQLLDGASHAGGAQEVAHKATHTRRRCAL
jgi:hypothetical protein